MTNYFRRTEIENLMQQLVNTYSEDCLSGGELNPDFAELIKHNFFAKYVFYNKSKKQIEIGVNESKGTDSLYPDIRVYKFSLDKVQSWMSPSFRYGKGDFEFYGKLLARNLKLKNPEVVVE